MQFGYLPWVRLESADFFREAGNGCLGRGSAGVLTVDDPQSVVAGKAGAVHAQLPFFQDVGDALEQDFHVTGFGCIESLQLQEIVTLLGGRQPMRKGI